MDASKNPALAGGAAPAEARQHFLDYWRIIRLRKAIILTVFFLVVATVSVVTNFLPSLYMSTVGMKVEKDTPDVAPFTAFGLPQQQFDPYFFNTEFEVLKSHRILDAVIVRTSLDKVYAKRLKLPEVTVQQAYEILSRNIDLKQRRNAAIIEISAYDQDKELARDIADAIAETYKSARGETRSKRFESGLTTLSNKVADLEFQVKVAQTNVDELRKSGKVSDLGPENPQYITLFTQTISRLEAARTQLRSEVAALEQTYEKVRARKGDDLRHFLAASNPTQELTALLGNLNQAKQKKVSLLTTLGEKHPDVQRVEKLLSEINDQIEKEVSGIRASMEARLDASKRAVDDLQKQIDEATEKSAKDLASSAPYGRAKRDMETLLRQKEAMQMELNQQVVNSQLVRDASVDIIDRALPGMRPVRPNKPLFIAIGAVAGLLLGFLLAFFIEYLDTSVKTIDDVEQALGAPVLGVIPQNVAPLIKGGLDSAHAEAYRVLRTNILFSRKDPDQRTLTVVSGGAGEGKSTTIFNLATVFAQQGSRVLIVDSDLRRPSLHKILGVANTTGLTNLLLRQKTFEEVVQTTPLDNLHFLPSGRLPSSSVGILSSPQMKEFIEETRRRYDYVFFDSPPIMGVSDASILASEMDMAVLVVQYRKYPQQMTVRAKQMVEKIGGPNCLLGVVLNNINISQDSYYYYYSGYYYDYYNKEGEEGGTAAASKDAKPEPNEPSKPESGIQTKY